MPPTLRGLIVPALLTLAALALLVSLGNWQLERLAWKTELIATATQRPSGPVEDLPAPDNWSTLDIPSHQYRPFRLTGSFLHDKQALVFTSLSDANGPHNGPGYWVVTPFALACGGTVLVNRGFIPDERNTPPDPGESPTGEPVTVEGLLRPDDVRNFFTPADKPDSNLFFARNIESIASAKHLPGPVAPFTIDLLASETPPGGLPQAGETRMAFTNNHLGYALTWYGLAAALVAVFASFAWTRLRGESGASRLTPPGPAP
jgi:surfeit locus 1 family protein